MEKEKSKTELKHEEVLQEFIDSLKNGVPKWRNGMIGKVGLAKNGETGKTYNGINMVNLSFMNNYIDNRWYTFVQAQKKGYTVKKGSKGTSVFYYNLRDYKTKKTFDPKTIEHLSIEEQDTYKNKYVKPVRNSSTVFNASQIDGVPPLEINTKEISIDEFQKKLIANSEAPIFFDQAGRNYYVPQDDTIHITELSYWTNENKLTSTLLHEITHSTGHETRLDRNLNAIWGDNSAIEEMVAELGTVLTMLNNGLYTDESIFENNKAYVDSWYKAVKEDSSLLPKIFSQAEKAFNYMQEHIIEKTITQDLTKEKEKNTPVVIFEWSENNSIPTNIEFSLKEADEILRRVEKVLLKEKDKGEYIGYDKTKFNIKCMFENEEFEYTGRYDIGDGELGLLNHLKSFSSMHNDEKYIQKILPYLMEEGKKESSISTFGIDTDKTMTVSFNELDTFLHDLIKNDVLIALSNPMENNFIKETSYSLQIVNTTEENWKSSNEKNTVGNILKKYEQLKLDLSETIIPEIIKNMEKTFAGCGSLAIAPKIPEGVVSLENTFTGCSSLQKGPVIPESVKNMKNTFSRCYSLQEAPVIPKDIKKLHCTFEDCKSLQEAPVISQGVEDLFCTFYGCESLIKAPVIPKSVTDMKGTFMRCVNLVEGPIIPESVVNMDDTFFCCKNLVEAPVIPQSVKSMNVTFGYCESLIKVPVLPNGVEYISEIFKECINLENKIEDSFKDRLKNELLKDGKKKDTLSLYGSIVSQMNKGEKEVFNNVMNKKIAVHWDKGTNEEKSLVVLNGWKKEILQQEKKMNQEKDVRGR